MEVATESTLMIKLVADLMTKMVSSGTRFKARDVYIASFQRVSCGYSVIKRVMNEKSGTAIQDRYDI